MALGAVNEDGERKSLHKTKGLKIDLLGLAKKDIVFTGWVKVRKTFGDVRNKR